jgi:hypothetical protein
MAVFPSTLDLASVALAIGARIRFFSEDAGAFAPAGITVNSTLPSVVLTGAVNAAASVLGVLFVVALEVVMAGVVLASVAGVALASVACVALEPAGVALASGVVVVAGVVLTSVVVAGVLEVVLELAGAVAVLLASAAGVALKSVAVVVAGVVAAGVLVSTGVVLAVVLVALASVIDPATCDALESESGTLAFLLAKSTCDPSFTVLSAPTSRPVEVKNLFNAIALRSGVMMKILPLSGLPITRYK